MFATSPLAADISRAKRFGVREYWVKPSNPGPRQFMDLALKLKAIIQPGASPSSALERSRHHSHAREQARAFT